MMTTSVNNSISLAPQTTLAVLPQTTPTNSTSSPTVNLPGVDPTLLKTVKESQQSANSQIAASVERIEARLAEFAKERKEAIATLKEPRPVTPQWTTEQSTTFNNTANGLMSTWRNGAKDAGGWNKNEDTQLKTMDQLIADAGKYLSFDKAMAMLGEANKDGRMGKGKKDWENGRGSEAIAAMRAFVDPAKTSFNQETTAWSDRQRVANTLLGNSSQMYSKAQDSATSTIALIKSMNLNDVASLYKNIGAWAPQNNAPKEDEEQRKPLAQVRVSVGSSPLQPVAQGALNVNVNVSFA